jgi:glycosyltransferase involved in cell wall biosynthesis
MSEAMRTSPPVVRILHLVPMDGIGGVEIAAKSLLARNDLPCIVKLLFISPSVQAAKSGLMRLLAPFQWFRDNVRAFGEARAFSPDLVICSLWRSIPLALMLRFSCSHLRLAFFIHNNTAMHSADAAMSWIAIRVADVVWGDSAATLLARGVQADRSRVISFVTDRLIAPDGHGATATFVSWGRISYQKGIDRSIRLIAVLAKRELDVRYEIYGPNGGERENLEVLVGELGVGDRVRFLGPVQRSALSDIAAQHRFFLQLSRSEGMCMAVVEAMQLGLVPVATAVGEMAQYVRSGDTGILVDPERIGAAANAVERLIRDEAAWHRHSVAAACHWRTAPLYAEDVCRAANALVYSGTDPSSAKP